MIMAEEWIPIVLFMCVTVIIVAVQILNSKHKEKVQDTLQKSIDSGQALSPDVINAMLVKNRPFEDMKKGIILIFIGLAIVTFSLLSGHWNAAKVMAVGAIPIIVGIGYVVIWKMRTKFE